MHLLETGQCWLGLFFRYSGVVPESNPEINSQNPLFEVDFTKHNNYFKQF